jgi:hypothetical protein
MARLARTSHAASLRCDQTQEQHGRQKLPKAEKNEVGKRRDTTAVHVELVPDAHAPILRRGEVAHRASEEDEEKQRVDDRERLQSTARQ